MFASKGRTMGRNWVHENKAIHEILARMGTQSADCQPPPRRNPIMLGFDPVCPKRGQRVTLTIMPPGVLEIRSLTVDARTAEDFAIESIRVDGKMVTDDAISGAAFSSACLDPDVYPSLTYWVRSKIELIVRRVPRVTPPKLVILKLTVRALFGGRKKSRRALSGRVHFVPEQTTWTNTWFRAVVHGNLYGGLSARINPSVSISPPIETDG